MKKKCFLFMLYSTKKNFSLHKQLKTKKNKINSLYYLKCKKIEDLSNCYDELLVNYFVRKARLATEMKECSKYCNISKLINSFHGLNKYTFFPDGKSIIDNFKNSYSIINYFDDINPRIKRLSDIILKDWATIHSIAQVEYRKKWGLLHTIPKKKLSLVQTVYPNIRSLIYESKIKHRENNKIIPFDKNNYHRYSTHPKKKVYFNLNLIKL